MFGDQCFYCVITDTIVLWMVIKVIECLVIKVVVEVLFTKYVFVCQLSKCAVPGTYMTESLVSYKFDSGY